MSFLRGMGQFAKELAQDTAKEALGTASSYTLDPYYLATTGEPTPTVDVPYVGQVKTAGRKAFEDPSVEGGLMALSEGVLGSAGLLAGGQALRGLAGRRYGLHSLKNMQGGFEGMPEAFTKGDFTKLVPQAGAGRISDLTQKLTRFSPELANKTKGLAADSVKYIGGAYPELTKLGTNAINGFVARKAAGTLIPGVAKGVTRSILRKAGKAKGLVPATESTL
jgi:hypothetical protein